MDVRQIAEQNPWWEDSERINDDEKVKGALSKRSKIEYDFEERNKIITGPRQVGKTTFLKLFIKHLLDKGTDPRRIIYFSCEPIRDFNDIIEIARFSDSLFTEGKKYIFLDEITFVDGWQRALKFILDSPLSKDKVIYVCGSSSIELKRETFPGRNIKTEHFLPLSFREFCNVFGSENLKKIDGIKTLTTEEINEKAKLLVFNFDEISRLFSLYVECGGFPRSMYELIENKNQNKNQNRKIEEETYEIYWNWLIADIAKAERSERIANSVLFGVLKNYGTRFSLNSVAKETEIGSHVTVRDYLELLENLFVLRSIFPLEPKKKLEAFRKMRKVYFTDPFLFHTFKKQLTRLEVRDEEVPKIVEGIVGEHLMRKFGRVSYYHPKARRKKEVDFHLNGSGIEVKWQKNVGRGDFPESEFKDKILLTKDKFEFFEKHNVMMLPVGMFLLLL